MRHKTGWERHGWIHNMYDLYNTEQQTANQAWINWCYVELEVFLPFNIPHAAGQSYESWYETKRRNIFWFLLAFKMLKYQPPEEGSSSLTACDNALKSTVKVVPINRRGRGAVSAFSNGLFAPIYRWAIWNILYSSITLMHYQIHKYHL